MNIIGDFKLKVSFNVSVTSKYTYTANHTVFCQITDLYKDIQMYTAPSKKLYKYKLKKCLCKNEMYVP